MTEDTNLDRRSVLKGLGGTAATAAVGATALVSMTGGASATGSFDYGDATVSSDDGSVEYVAIYGDSKVTWDGFDTKAQSFSLNINLSVQTEDGTEITAKEIHSTGLVDLSSDWGDDEALSGPGTSGDIESAIGQDSSGNHDPATDWHIVGTDPDGYGLPKESIDASALKVNDGGTTKTYTLVMDSTYTWYDASDSAIFTETFTSELPVAVTNEPKSGSVSDGDGEDGSTAA